MKEVTKAYLAGVIDGEGTIGLERNNSNERRSPNISVTNTSMEILEIFRKNYGGTIVKQKRYEDHTYRQGRTPRLSPDR